MAFFNHWCKMVISIAIDIDKLKKKLPSFPGSRNLQVAIQNILNGVNWIHSKDVRPVNF